MAQTSNALWALLIGAVVTVLIWGLEQVPLFRAFEYRTLDAQFQLRMMWDQSRPSDQVVLAAIDDKTLNELDRWPLPRSYHGRMLAFLADEKPAVVTWDILFTERTRRDPEQDLALVEGARLLPHVVVGAARDEDNARANPPLDQLGRTKPLTRVTGDASQVPSFTTAQLPFDTVELPDGQAVPGLLSAAAFGFVDSNQAEDTVRRSLPLVVHYRDAWWPSLELQTLMDYLGIGPENVEVILGKEVRITRSDGGVLAIPIDARGEMLINYRYPLEKFPAPNYVQLGAGLEAKQQEGDHSGLAGLPPLAGRIVYFGVTAKGFDTGATPLSKNVTPLVMIRLNALNNMLTGDFLRQVSPWAFYPILFVVTAFFALTLLRAGFFQLLPLTAATLIIYIAVATGLFQLANQWVPTALPIGGLCIVAFCVTSFRYFGEEREKLKIKKAMSAYLPEKVMARVLEHPEQLKLGGQKREISVLFCDIRGFTKYCEYRDPVAVVDVLNEYLEVMTEVIFRYDGTVDKYIGDCIMAFWNAPEDQIDHAQRAVCCAMEMRYALAHYKTKRAGIDTEVFECGIGIHTGEALVGNVGSSKQMGYTAIGATVNLAARLEALTKRFNSRIIVSEATVAQIAGDFTVTELGEVSVTGFENRQRLYAIEAYQDITSALKVGKAVAAQAAYTADDVTAPLHEPVALPEDAEIADANEDPEIWRQRMAARPQQPPPAGGVSAPDDGTGTA